MKNILWVAVQVSDFLSRRIFLTQDVLAFVWVGSEALGRAVLLVVVYVDY